MQAKGQVRKISFARGIGVGIIASFVGTIMMDLIMIVQFSMAGQPALTYLDPVGSVFGGGVPVSALVHIVTTVVLGIVFSVPVLTIEALRIDTVKKGILLGYLTGVGFISACVPFALLLRQPIPVVLSFMAIPGLVWWIGVGIGAGYGMRPAIVTRDS